MVSIIIVTYNSQDQIKDCLKSVSINRKSDHEITVVDNNSKDKTSQVIKRNFPKVNLIKNKTNIGFARACNQGAKVAKGKYLLFLNPDTIVKQGCIETMVEFIKSKKDAAVVGCKTLNSDGSLQPSCGNFPTILNVVFDRIPLLNKLFSTQLIRKESFYAKEQTPDWMSGAFFLARKDIFTKLGGFDKRYFMYGEDVDFCYRAKKAGYKIYYNPKAEVTHFDMGKSPERKGFKAINMRKGFTIFFEKYKTPFYCFLWKLFLKTESKFSEISFFVFVILFLFLLVVLIPKDAVKKILSYLNSPKISSKNVIESYDSKFRELKTYLPYKGVIGYISDDKDESVVNSVLVNKYYLAQYSLAPLIIIHSTIPKLIIGNFNSNDNIKDILQKNKLIIVKDFRNGLVLFKHSY